MTMWPPYGFDDGAEERTYDEIRRDHAFGATIACNCAVCRDEDE